MIQILEWLVQPVLVEVVDGQVSRLPAGQPATIARDGLATFVAQLEQRIDEMNTETGAAKEPEPVEPAKVAKLPRKRATPANGRRRTST